jgi:hypothetical protein
LKEFLGLIVFAKNSEKMVAIMVAVAVAVVINQINAVRI